MIIPRVLNEEYLAIDPHSNFMAQLLSGVVIVLPRIIVDRQAHFKEPPFCGLQEECAFR